MESQDAPQHGFPTGRILALLSVVGLSLLAVLWLVLPMLFADVDATREAVLIMGLVAWLSSLISVLPVTGVSATRSRNVLLFVKAYFLGAGARVVACLLAVVFVIKSRQLPEAPTVVTLMVMYLPLLFIETASVTRFIKSPHGPSAAPRPTAANPATEAPA